MLDTLKKCRILNGNALKIIAAVTMFIDHFGLMFYPQHMIFRIIGRLAMPLFAFMIAESARYTRNKIKHFAMLFGLGAICQIVYYFFANSTYLSILITFSMSTLILYALEAFKTSLFAEYSAKTQKMLPPPLISSFVLILTITGAYWVCKSYKVDYGFWGCMMPVFANLFDFRAVKKTLNENEKTIPNWIGKIDVLPLRVACFAVGMLLFHFLSKTPLPTAWMFLTIPLLLMYNGEKGKKDMKYFFYIFYPLHLVTLEGLYMLMQKL